MNRDQVLRRIDSAWLDFIEVIDSVPDDLVDVPGAVGFWSVKDIIGHVETWDREALDSLRQFVGDRDTRALVSWPDVDEFNARQWEAKRNTDLFDLRHEMENTHGHLMEFLSSLPEEEFALEQVQERIQIDTYGHYEDHGPEIRRWLKVQREPNLGR